MLLPRPRDSHHRLLPPVLLLVLAACAGTRPSPVTGIACSGQTRLTITNNANVPIEVHTAATASTMLGYVETGERGEFVLPGGVRSVYTLANAGGRRYALARQDRPLVRLQYDCVPTSSS